MICAGQLLYSCLSKTTFPRTADMFGIHISHFRGKVQDKA